MAWQRQSYASNLTLPYKGHIFFKIKCMISNYTKRLVCVRIRNEVYLVPNHQRKFNIDTVCCLMCCQWCCWKIVRWKNDRTRNHFYQSGTGLTHNLEISEAKGTQITQNNQFFHVKRHSFYPMISVYKLIIFIYRSWVERFFAVVVVENKMC